MKKLLLLILLIVLIIWLYRQDFTAQQKLEWGVSFNTKYAEELGLDWQKAYTALLDELKFRKIRLGIYWSEMEKKEGEYDFSQVDWLIQEAQKREAKVMLVVGYRTPRWPECHFPNWLRTTEGGEFRQKVLSLLEAEVSHFKKFENITAWQVENEPLLGLFGQCPAIDKELLKQEFALVKSLDSRPVYITDSGELSLWLRTPKFSDYLATTMYSVVWNKYFGYFRHIYPPAWYAYRTKLVKKFFKTQEVIISELQAEAWIGSEKQARDFDLSKQIESFSIDELEKNIALARESGFTTAYLWGAEWWYWLRKEKGHPEYWEYIKGLLNK